MPNWIDILIPLLVFLATVWGFTTGYWDALVGLLSVLIGLTAAARFDGPLAETLLKYVTSPSISLVQALVFVILVIIATSVASGIVGWLFGFARPTTRAARSLPSAHLLGALFGFGVGAVVASVVLMAANLASSDTGRQVNGAAALRATINQAVVVRPVFRLVHMEQRGLARVVGPSVPPPFQVP